LPTFGVLAALSIAACKPALSSATPSARTANSGAET
jgi:hypothetical protein